MNNSLYYLVIRLLNSVIQNKMSSNQETHCSLQRAATPNMAYTDNPVYWNKYERATLESQATFGERATLESQATFGERATHATFGERATHATFGERATHATFGERATHATFGERATHQVETCMFCLGNFIPAVADESFCSKECYTAHRMVPCLSCSKTFVPEVAGQSFCSEECYIPPCSFCNELAFKNGDQPKTKGIPLCACCYWEAEQEWIHDQEREKESSSNAARSDEEEVHEEI
jgi:hypothetical protein